MKKHLLFIGMLMAYTGSIFAQAPSNNTCAGASVLSINNISPVLYLTNATESAPACAGDSAKDVWYSFTATASAMKVEVYSEFDGVFEILDSCGGSTIECVDDYYEDEIEWYYNTNFVVGSTYFIRVYEYDALTDTGFYVIAVSEINPQTNDSCIYATTLVAGDTLFDENLGGASESMAACAGNDAADLWYSFTPTDSIVTIEVFSNLDLVMEIVDSCGGTGYVCIDDYSSGGGESITAVFYTGQEYLIRVYDYDGALDTGYFDITVSQESFAANNHCENAIVLTVDSLLDGQNTQNTSQAYGACSGNYAFDVWYEFTATTPSMTIEVDAEFDAVFELIDTCGGSSLLCVDEEYLDPESIYVTGFEVGTSYLIRVYEYDVETDTGSFSILVSSVQTPANDSCVNATALTLGVELVGEDIAGASESDPVPCEGAFATDVWYSFTPVSSGVGVEIETEMDVVFEVLDGCNGNSIACVDELYEGESSAVTGLTAGQQYLIRVYEYDAIADSGVFNIEVYDLPPPANDLCDSAASLMVYTSGSEVYTSGNTAGAMEELLPCAGDVGADVWYSFQAPSSGGAYIDVTVIDTGDVDPVFELYDACNGNSIACIDDNAEGVGEFHLDDNLSAGQTYYVRVYDYDNLNTLDAPFEITVIDSVVFTTNITQVASHDYSVFPNPNNTGLLNLLSSEITNKTTVSLLNPQGQLLLSEVFVGNTSVNISDLAAGIYFVEFKNSNGESYTEQLIVK